MRSLPLSLSLLVLALPAAGAERTSLRFEVSVAKGLLSAPTPGRVLVVLAKGDRVSPRFHLGETGANVPPVLGIDSKLDSGGKAVLDQSAAIYPLRHLAQLPAGEYHVQAVFDYNRDLRLSDAPGNLISEPVKVTLDPKDGGTVKIVLTKKLPDEKLPDDTAHVKYLKIKSEKLSKFYGRPIYLRAGVVLPQGHAKDKDRKYPLRVHVGGFGSRYTRVGSWMEAGTDFREAWEAKGAPRMLVLMLDGAGPLGDPYQVNSANHGPYGDAVTQELIPYVEKTYRGVGKGSARVLDGASTGGWVSLALQVFYPDFFNGAWSHAPDPVDFRAFQLMNVYRDPNAFVNRFGFERPGARDLDGETKYTMRSEVTREVVLGRGDRWTLSGKDWGSWNAVFSPRGDDGFPVPLWDQKTGKIDRKVAEHWQKYDLRLHLEKYRATLAPKLRGKLRIWVGDADEYFLNNAVYLLDDFFKGSKPSFDAKITYGRRQGHDWEGLSEKDMVDQMAKATGAERK
jgi:hypothetical protein